MFDNPNFPQSFREYKNLIRAEKKWNKCFGIGSNKTTSTLNYIFQNYMDLVQTNPYWRLMQPFK